MSDTGSDAEPAEQVNHWRQAVIDRAYTYWQLGYLPDHGPGGALAAAVAELEHLGEGIS